MKTLRYSLYGLLGLVLLVVAGAAIFVATLDANRYKADIEALVLKHTGRVLIIEGDFAVTLYPSLAISIKQASLSEPIAGHGGDTNAAPTDPFVRLKSTRLSMGLLPLLKGNVLVDGIDIEGLDVRLVRHAQGTLSIQDLLDRVMPSAQSSAASTTTPSQPTTVTKGTKPLTIDIRAVNIKDSRLIFIDERSKQRLDLSNITLATEQLAPNASGQLTTAFRLQTSSPPSDATIELKSRYELALADQRITLSEARTKIQGRWQDLQSITAELTFDAQADLNNRRYQFDTVNAQATAQLTSPARTPTDSATQTQAVSTSSLSLKAQTPQVLLNANEINTQAGSLSAEIAQGARRVNAQIGLPAWQWRNQATKFDRLAIDLVMMDADISQAPIRLSLAGPFEINLKQSTIKSALSGQFNASPLTLSSNIQGLASPAITFDAHLQTLDLTEFTAGSAPPSTTAQGASVAQTTGAATNTAANAGVLDFSGLQGRELKGQLRIDTIRTQATPITELNSAINLTKGRLTVGPHQAKIWGGQVKGSLVIDANTQTVSIDEAVSNVDIESLLQSVAASDALSGRGNLTAQLSATGASRDAMLRSLAGQLGLQLKDGAVKGIDVQAILRAARAALGKAPTQSATTDGQTRFTELTATATIKNGVADNQDLRIKAPLFRVEGSGTVDIAAGQLNYLAKVAVVETPDGQGGADIQALRGVTVPVRLTGPISQPSYRVDIAALASELAKSRLNDNLKDQINKAVPGLGDALKGLFGR